MDCSKAMTVVRQVYDYVESALWAALLAFVIYFAAAVVPTLPETARRAESIRAARIAAENAAYCEKWGMKQGTHAHTHCRMDLQELRSNIEREISGEGGVF